MVTVPNADTVGRRLALAVRSWRSSSSAWSSSERSSEFSERSVERLSTPSSTSSRRLSRSPATSISTSSGIERYILSISFERAIEFSVWRIVGRRLLNCTSAVSRSYSDIRPFSYCTRVSSTVRCTLASDSRSTSSDCSASRILKNAFLTSAVRSMRDARALSTAASACTRFILSVR